MFRIKIVSTLLLATAALWAGAGDFKLPVSMADVAASLKDHAPEHVSIAAKGEMLTITISESARKGGFDKTHSINFKRLAGKTVTIVLDVKVNNVEGGGVKASHNVGRITFSGTSQYLTTSKSDWQTCVFKNVKIPGNGLLKMRISLKNVSGEIQIRNPRGSYRGGSSKSHSSGSKSRKSKKNKKNKNQNND